MLDVSPNEQDKVAVMLPKSSPYGALRGGIRCADVGASIVVKSAFAGTGNVVKTDLTSTVARYCDNKTRFLLNPLVPELAWCDIWPEPDHFPGGWTTPVPLRVTYQCVCEQGVNHALP